MQCGLFSVESLIIKARLRWAGHIVLMPNGRIPKMLLCGQLKEGQRGLGRPLLCFRDTLEANRRRCRINAENREDTAADRERWRQQVDKQATTESVRVKRERRKHGALTSTQDKVPLWKAACPRDRAALSNEEPL